MGIWGEDVLRHKYDPLPEDAPRHRKKTKKVHVRSDHRHVYEDVLIDAGSYVYSHGEKHPYFYIGTRCKVCGRLQDFKHGPSHEDRPEGMRTFKLNDWLQLFSLKELPDSMEVTSGLGTDVEG